MSAADLPGSASESGEQVGENVCPACGGRGTVRGEACGSCAGTGTVVEPVGDA